MPDIPDAPPDDEVIEEKLTLKQEKFCQLYATNAEFFGNGAQSYIEAYRPDQNKPNWYKSVQSSASRLLANVKIFTRINKLLEETGFNDADIDKQLSFIIHQQADFASKLGAIKEYNKLKQRITEKMDLTTKGEKIIPILGGISNGVPSDDGDPKDNPTS